MDNNLCFSKFSETMVEIAIGKAVCIETSDDFFGWIFINQDGHWVSNSKATPLEMAQATSRKAMINSSLLQQNESPKNQLTDNSCANIPYTPEEDAEFARIERNQDIALLANVIRSSPTTSAEAIAARVLDAGYQFSGSAVRLK